MVGDTLGRLLAHGGRKIEAAEQKGLHHLDFLRRDLFDSCDRVATAQPDLGKWL